MNSAQGLSSIELTKMTSNPKALQDGSSVFVRVLSKGDGAAYTVSFSGSTFSVFSQRELQTGSAFRALVNIKDGKIFLTPQAESTNTVQKFSVSTQESISQLQTFFHDLGLKSDVVSLRIVQYFQSAGASFNMKLANKARAIAQKFPGKEDEAAEITLLLEQRGVNADMDTVIEVFNSLYGGNREQGEFEDEENESTSNDDSEIVVDDTQVRKNTWDDEQSEDLDVLKNIYSNPESVIQKETGLLTFINHVRTNPLHWIILPFEYGENGREITGSIRILLNYDKKTTENVTIYAFFCGKNYKFVVKYKSKVDGSVSKQQGTIQFCSEQNESEQNEKVLCEMLKTCLPQDFNFDVSYSKELANDGLFTLASHISVVKLDA